MKCVIPGPNCRILGRAIHALAKISEEMYVEPREKSLSFRSVSPSNSAYCDFTFKDIYFSSYNFGNLEEEDALKCKISMKSALTVFKSLPVIEKLVETCHIRLEPNADQLIFIFKFKNSVVKTFFLPIIDCEQLSVPFTKDDSPNKLSAKSRVLSDVVQNFQQNLVEMTLQVTPQKLLMRNYVDETSIPAVANSTRTQLAVTIGEFDEYKVGLEAQITFCLKEFKAILSFAEAVTLPLSVYFETTGKPVFFDLKNPSFEANLVLSTLNPESDDNSTMTDQEIRQTVRKRKAQTKKTPRQAVKPSRRKSTNRSIVSNKSANIRTNISNSVSNRTNLPDVSNRMEVDDNDASTSGINGACLNNTNLPKVRDDPASSDDPTRENVKKRSAVSQNPSTFRPTTSQYFSPVVSSLDPMSNRPTEPSIFSPTWKKQTDNNEKNNDNTDVPMDEDEIPGSPPPPVKRAKIIFKKCFQSTFDPRMLPGHDSILADDSDEGD